MDPHILWTEHAGAGLNRADAIQIHAKSVDLRAAEHVRVPEREPVVLIVGADAAGGQHVVRSERIRNRDVLFHQHVACEKHLLVAHLIVHAGADFMIVFAQRVAREYVPTVIDGRGQFLRNVDRRRAQ